MSDELLAYYNREITYIRRLASHFGEAHPKIAERLRLGQESSDDPHVERLIQAFAYLTARIRHKLDDDLPEISEALLGVLYPHYQAPIPSMSVVQFEPDPEQAQLTAGYLIPRHTEIETEPIQGDPCRFRTCYPVTLWPIEVTAAELVSAPFSAPRVPYAVDAAAVLRVALRCQAVDVGFSALPMRSVRFYLKGLPHHVYRLYELILNDAIGVALGRSPADASPVLLAKEQLRPVGFERDEGMLPYPARSFVGYRLLTEFFAFPQKYLFFDLTLPPGVTLERFDREMEIYVYANRAVPELARNVSSDTFRLGCAPVVNLYARRAEPIALTQTEFEYRVVPDSRRPLAHEVYSIDRVTASAPDGRVTEFVPLFSVKHARGRDADDAYWHSTRRPAEGAEELGDRGTEVFVSLVDLALRPSAAADWVVDVETTCLNRDLPRNLPFGGGQPRLQLSEGGALVSRITCLTPPTRTLRPALRHGTLWRLISHLSLNHLSIVDGDDQGGALREILKLYDFNDSPETRKLVDGVTNVKSRQVVGNARTSGPASFCRGVEVTIELDPERFTGSGLFLFASVLERFVALYCNVNTFTKLVATVRGREGELRRWPPRVGERVMA
jgi:type VI secretion system protein ImpG